MSASDISQHIPVGGPGDVSNVNPNTADFMVNLTGLLEKWLSGGDSGPPSPTLDDVGSDLQGNVTNPFISELAGLDPLDPNAGFNAFMNFAPGLQGLAQDVTQPFAKAQMDLAKTGSQQAIQGTLSNFSGANAVNSGAAVGSATKAGGEVFNQAVSNITGQQSQLAGGLLGTALGLFPGAYQGAYDSNLNRLLGAGGLQDSLTGRENERFGLRNDANANLLNLFGLDIQNFQGNQANSNAQLNTILGNMLGVSTPEWFMPAFTNNADYISTEEAIALAIEGAGLIPETIGAFMGFNFPTTTDTTGGGGF